MSNTRRKVDYTIEPDMFGFDPVGADYMVCADERRALLGMGPLCMALYYTCLKPFAKLNGRIYALSYYRLHQMLKHKQPAGGGPRFVDATEKEVRSAVVRLEKAGLVMRSTELNEKKGVLQIWLSHGVGTTAPVSVRAGVRAGLNRSESRIDAGFSPELSTSSGRG